jgi:aryl carrier-like protein
MYPIHQVLPEWKSIPYGRPLSNQSIHVLNTVLEACVKMEPGHIYIGGKGLALGYWRDEERTRESFITHPLTGEHIYRTGDLGRLLPDGNVEILGREDQQVKLRGYRVELGEIEVSLRSHPRVREAVAVVIRSPSGQSSLAAVIRPEGIVSIEELKQHVAERLPDYMVPHTFTFTDSFPLTSNRKVDRSAIAEGFEPPQTSVAPPTPQTAETGPVKRITELIQEVLELPSLRADSDLLTLGANSIDLVRVINVIYRKLGFRIDIEAVYANPTPSGIAGLCVGSAEPLTEPGNV